MFTFIWYETLLNTSFWLVIHYRIVMITCPLWPRLDYMSLILLYLRLVGMCMWITTIKYNFWEQFCSGIDGKKNNPHFFLSQKGPWVSESLRSQSTVKLWLQNGYCLGFPALWLADCAVEAQPCNAAHAGLGIISIHFLWKSLLLSPDLNCFLFLLNCYSI